jgi:hypothetical protein
MTDKKINKRITRYIINNLKNIPGKRTNRKIIVIECDDWCGIRMPSKEVYDKMLADGLPLDNCRFTKFDTLEDKEDLEFLFDVLLSVKDKYGKPAVITPVCSVANPDFEKIKELSYKKYFFEPFTKTLEKYNRDPQTFTTWQKGIEEGIFVPESHGREHISVQLWLKKLQESNKNLLKAFEYGFVALDVDDIPQTVRKFRPEFFFDNPIQIEFLLNSITSGISLFKEIFGFKPNAFVPSNSIFHPLFEKVVSKNNVKYLYACHYIPVPDSIKGVKRKFYLKGKKNKDGLTYYSRNCVFEPTDSGYKGIDYTLNQIDAAFRWKKPAIISSHRVNFVGGIDKRNREIGLKELRKLLNLILAKYPDVEFMNSKEMFKVLYENEKNEN